MSNALYRHFRTLPPRMPGRVVLDRRLGSLGLACGLAILGVGLDATWVVGLAFMIALYRAHRLESEVGASLRALADWCIALRERTDWIGDHAAPRATLADALADREPR